MEERLETARKEAPSAAELLERETGIDISLIEHCLGLSHEQRLESHESARQLIRELQEAGRKLYAGKS